MNVAGLGMRPPSYTTAPVFALSVVMTPRSLSRYTRPLYRIGETTYAVPLSYVHATRSASVLGDAPGRMAITRRSGNPAVAMTRPSPTSGVWIALLLTPAVRHNSLPLAGS